MTNKEAIKRRYTFGNDEFNLEAAYHDCKLVFDGITDDDSFQEADTGLILYYANEIIYALHEALEGKDIDVPSIDTISRQAAIDATWFEPSYTDPLNVLTEVRDRLKALPSAQPEPLTDDDFETIRIHLNAYKEKLCNQQRWKEAEEYQRIIDRFMAFAFTEPKTCAYWDSESNICALHRPSAQPESAQWVQMFINPNLYKCSNCQVAWNKRFVFDNEGYSENIFMKYCPCCGRKMKTKVDYE